LIQRVIGPSKCVGDSPRERSSISLTGEVDVVQGAMKVGISDRAANEIDILLTAQCGVDGLDARPTQWTPVDGPIPYSSPAMRRDYGDERQIAASGRRNHELVGLEAARLASERIDFETGCLRCATSRMYAGGIVPSYVFAMTCFGNI
jgi:hypothetical protein